jgi:hypothetical protein
VRADAPAPPDHCEQLAKHLTEWVLEFSLRTSERELIPPGRIVAVVREAASRVYATDAVSRGEAGELLLHAACRQEFGTQQLVARLYYKSSLDQQVHGFDCVHFRTGAGGKIELWLGESKLYSDVNSAIARARISIKEHLDRGFLKFQKLLILPKIADEDKALAATVQHPSVEQHSTEPGEIIGRLLARPCRRRGARC